MEDIAKIWEFVEEYYPNYFHSDKIAYSDDLQKLMDGQINGCAERLWYDEFNQDIELVEEEYNRVHREIYETTILEYLKTKE